MIKVSSVLVLGQVGWTLRVGFSDELRNIFIFVVKDLPFGVRYSPTVALGTPDVGTRNRYVEAPFVHPILQIKRINC